MIRGHRWAFALPTILAIGVLASAAAALDTQITSGSVGITGSGTVVVNGPVVIFGSVRGPHPLMEITTTKWPEQFVIGGHVFHIARNADLTLDLASGQTFFSHFPQTVTRVRVRLRGAKIATTVAGTATITLSGTGTYTPFNGKPKKWPKTPVQLR